MRDVLSVIASAFLALAAWTATVSPSQAETGTVRVVFGAAGVVAGVGSGEGTLTFHGNTYPFKISGATFGATLALTVSEYEGRIAPRSVELYEAVVAVNDVKRPSQFGQERDGWSPFRSERPARPAAQEVACRL